MIFVSNIDVFINSLWKYQLVVPVNCKFAQQFNNLFLVGWIQWVWWAGTAFPIWGRRRRRRISTTPSPIPGCSRGTPPWSAGMWRRIWPEQVSNIDQKSIKYQILKEIHFKETISPQPLKLFGLGEFHIENYDELFLQWKIWWKFKILQESSVTTPWSSRSCSIVSADQIEVSFL